MEPSARRQLLDCIFDTDNARIIGLLEDGPKETSDISDKCGIAPGEIMRRIVPLVSAGILVKSADGDAVLISVDMQRLADIVESDDMFDGAIDGLVKLDGYLN